MQSRVLKEFGRRERALVGIRVYIRNQKIRSDVLHAGRVAVPKVIYELVLFSARRRSVADNVVDVAHIK